MNEKSIDDPMYVEWRAWQLVVQEMRALGIEPNDPQVDKLVRCIQSWGELLVSLRLEQTELIRNEARAQAMLRVLNVGIPAFGPSPPADREIAPR